MVSKIVLGSLPTSESPNDGMAARWGSLGVEGVSDAVAEELHDPAADTTTAPPSPMPGTPLSLNRAWTCPCGFGWGCRGLP